MGGEGRAACESQTIATEFWAGYSFVSLSVSCPFHLDCMWCVFLICHLSSLNCLIGCAGSGNFQDCCLKAHPASFFPSGCSAVFAAVWHTGERDAMCALRFVCACVFFIFSLFAAREGRLDTTAIDIMIVRGVSGVRHLSLQSALLLSCSNSVV